MNIEDVDIEKGGVGLEDDAWDASYSRRAPPAPEKEKEEMDAEDELRPPEPVHLLKKKFRFSTATQDGVWWFV